MFCPKCGKQIDSNMKFCAGCGADLASVPVQQNTQPAPKPIPPVKPFKPIKPAKITNKAPSESGKLKFTKNDAIDMGLWLGLAASYVCISLIFIMIFNMEKTISVASIFNNSFKSQISLQNFMDILSMGNRLFNTTVLSKALSIGIEIFFYSVPAFAALALASTFFSKGKLVFHVTSSIVSFISAILLAVVVPVSFGLIPGFKTALGTRIGMLPEDMGKISYTPFIIHAIAVALLIAISTVFAVMLNKRRNKK